MPHLFHILFAFEATFQDYRKDEGYFSLRHILKAPGENSFQSHLFLLPSLTYLSNAKVF